MVNLQYFEHSIALEPLHIEGTALLSGMPRKQAIEFAEDVVSSLESSGVGTVTFDHLTRYSGGLISDRDIKRRYTSFNDYLNKVYQGQITQPFFIFLGGAASAGKDKLVSDLQHLVPGMDRVSSTDLIRETARTELLQRHPLEEIPSEKQPLFEALYRLPEEQAAQQLEMVKEASRKYFVGQALRECETWMHPFYILQGVHVTLDYRDIVEGDNKTLAIVSPSRRTLSSRIRARQERERGPAETENEKSKRMSETMNTLEQRDRFEYLAKENGNFVINADNWVEVLHSFGNHLIGRLERILEKQAIIT